MKNKIFLFAIFLLAQSFSLSYASCIEDSVYVVSDLCKNNDCSETWTGEVTISTTDSFSLNSYTKKNFKASDVENKILFYETYFHWINYEINWYCLNESCSSKENKSLSLEQITSINNEFSLDNWKTYANGTNFFLRNYNIILEELHYKLFGTNKEYNISEISENIAYIGTDSNFFRIKNVCNNYNCSNSRVKDINLNDSTNYVLLSSWTKTSFDLEKYTKHKYEDSYFNLDKTLIKAGWNITTSFWFSDIMPNSWCWIKSYTYQIYQEFDDDWIKHPLLNWNWQSFFVNTTTWEVSWSLDELNFLHTEKDWNILKVEIREPFIITKESNIKFYIEIKDENENYKSPLRAINEYYSLDVIASEPVVWESIIESGYDRTLNYYPFDTFNFKIILKDIYWNIIRDTNKWLDISYPFSYYKLSSNVWTFTEWSISAVKSSWDYFEFRFQPEKSWYYEKTFNIDFYKKDANWNSTSVKIPIELKDSTNWWKIYIWSIWSNNDFDISCTNKDIVLKTKCESDDLSWCNPIFNQTKTFTWNVWTGSLIIKDYAHNQKSFSYNIQHIDKIIPEIKIDWYSFPSNNNIKATDSILLEFSDETAPACNAENFLKYSIYNKNNPSEIYYSGTSSIWDLSKIINLDILKFAWNKSIVIKVEDKYWNVNLKEIVFNVVPKNVSETKSSISYVSSSWEYANNSDFHTFKLTLKDDFWNPVTNKSLIFINQECILVWCKTLKTNMIDNSWTDALLEYDWWTVSNANWEIFFKIKSLSPWEFSYNFKMKLYKWDNNYNNIALLDNINIDNTNKNSFKKPFIANIKVSDDDWATWWWSEKLSFWTALKYKLDLQNLSSISSYNIDNFISRVKATDEVNYSIVNKSAISDFNSDPKFDATINTSLTASSITSDIWVKIEPSAIINYNLWWENILYYLTNSSSDYGNTAISIENTNNFVWVKIVWSLQWQWKQEITWQEKNVSDLSKQTLRWEIRKNAYKYISSLSSSASTNKVKYVEWDFTLSWNPSYETLVVKNWNLFIDWDLNISKKSFWIIVLKDWYNPEIDFSGKWNIYVGPSVKEINALIFADWWLISSNSSWNPYLSDTSTRSVALKKQLFINWTLFTRNTIWGSILAWWSYKLPWWSNTTDFNKAMIYDLNYLRRWKESCLELNPWTCKYNAWTVIFYDSKAQSNPPELFKK